MSGSTPCHCSGSALAQDRREEVRVSVRASVRPRLTPSEEASREEENALRTGTLRCHFESAARSATNTRLFCSRSLGMIPAIYCRVGVEALHALGTDEKFSRGALFPFRAASVMSLVIREARPRPTKAMRRSRAPGILARKNPDPALVGRGIRVRIWPAKALFSEGKKLLIHTLLASPIS